VSLNSFIADVLKRETEVPQVGKDPGVKTGKRSKKELAA